MRLLSDGYSPFTSSRSIPAAGQQEVVFPSWLALANPQICIGGMTEVAGAGPADYAVIDTTMAVWRQGKIQSYWRQVLPKGKTKTPAFVLGFFLW
jgi:hypothetical protein